MESIRVNDSPKNLDCEGEEISRGDVDSRKVCSAKVLDRKFGVSCSVVSDSL